MRNGLPKRLVSYNWSGNVKQLKHCIESAVNFLWQSRKCRFPTATYLSFPIIAKRSIFSAVDNKNKQIIIEALRNVTQKAKHMNMSEGSLNCRMRKDNIVRKES